MSSKITVVKEVDYRVIEVISAGPQGASGNTGQGSGTVTGVSGGTALTVTGNANVDPTVNHDAFGTASTYSYPESITTNSTGHITAAIPGSLPLLANNNLSDVNANAARTNLGVPGTNHTHVAGNIISGEFNVDRIPALPAAKITSGVLSTARIPTLSTGSISGLGTSATVDVPSSGNAASDEVVKGSDTRLSDARTPVTGWAGSGSITQVGTITSGTWDGTAIAYADVSGTPTLGTAAAAATGDFESSGSITTHNAITTAHGISTFGASLVDDADATAARATLQAAPTNHDHSGSQITSGVVADDFVNLRPDMGATFDGQGSVVQGSKTVLVPVERSGVITAAALVGDAIGSITIDVKRYTPSGLGTLGSATTMGSITISSRQHIRDTILSGWTTSISAGDILSFATSGTIATVTRVTVKVKIEDS